MCCLSLGIIPANSLLGQSSTSFDITQNVPPGPAVPFVFSHSDFANVDLELYTLTVTVEGRQQQNDGPLNVNAETILTPISTTAGGCGGQSVIDQQVPHDFDLTCFEDGAEFTVLVDRTAGSCSQSITVTIDIEYINTDQYAAPTPKSSVSPIMLPTNPSCVATFAQVQSNIRIQYEDNVTTTGNLVVNILNNLTSDDYTETCTSTPHSVEYEVVDECGNSTGSQLVDVNVDDDDAPTYTYIGADPLIIPVEGSCMVMEGVVLDSIDNYLCKPSCRNR